MILLTWEFDAATTSTAISILDCSKLDVLLLLLPLPLKVITYYI
jgi:hypothetical protein